jgi:hypothetical protein
LYLRGAKLKYLSAIMPVSDGMGLVFSVTGYGDTIVISFTACAEQVPDPEVFAQCLRDSFQEYIGLVPLLSQPKTRRAAKATKATQANTTAARPQLTVVGANPKKSRRKTTSATEAAA